MTGAKAEGRLPGSLGACLPVYLLALCMYLYHLGPGENVQNWTAKGDGGGGGPVVVVRRRPHRPLVQRRSAVAIAADDAAAT